MAAAARGRVSERLGRRKAYSYRGDASVPPFPDDKAVIVYDGVCVLCSAAMRTIARRDTAGRYRFIIGQSALGQALFRHYGLEPGDFETVLLIEDGGAWASSTWCGGWRRGSAAPGGCSACSRSCLAARRTGAMTALRKTAIACSAAATYAWCRTRAGGCA
jgi:hypothetical protein